MKTRRESASMGGKVRAIQQRKAAIEKYYLNPNYCLECGKIIDVGNSKVCEIRRKKFCNHICSAKYSNKNRVRIKKIKIKKEIVKFDIGVITKQELFKERKNWQSARSMIRRDAAKKYFKSKEIPKCEHCEYDKHIEVCHIKPVSDFDDGTLIKEINSLENLIGLCPNCHWEFDHNLLTLEEIKGIKR